LRHSVDSWEEVIEPVRASIAEVAPAADHDGHFVVYLFGALGYRFGVTRFSSVSRVRGGLT
jgi:hypothetical protein